MAEPALPPEPDGAIRFGRTMIIAVVGDLLDQRAEGVVFPANRRGVLGAVSTLGMVGRRPLGGSEIEREAMAQAPLELGTAIVTGATGLESRGVRHVVHAVVHRALGEPARVEDMRRAVGATILGADQARLRTLAIPLLGVDSGPGLVDPEPFVVAFVEETVATIRRSSPRLDRFTVTCRFQDHADATMKAFLRARERSWVRSR
ncbi:MAG: macro domain-containing protein [Chloroflexia bacterium]|nr:macro domain-containing protein [Chloroflexia bacterium]